MATTRWLPGMRITASRLDELLNPPDFVGRQTGSQLIPDAGSTFTPITLGVADIDTHGGWSAGAPARYTAQVAGVYQLAGSVSYNQVGGGGRGMVLRVNGGTYVRGSGAFSAGSSSTITVPASAPRDWYLAVGDYVELCAYQTSGGAVGTFVNADQAPMLSIRRVRGSL
ncbi:hypothetical protein [Yinghuangia sp. YIM S09857]|uniref:hypothetical protein n=1 Tax=Yinghuangia sp. YIM S09857 TaxID=3436929 RepID=UPI003F5291A5